MGAVGNVRECRTTQNHLGVCSGNHGRQVGTVDRWDNRATGVAGRPRHGEAVAAPAIAVTRTRISADVSISGILAAYDNRTRGQTRRVSLDIVQRLWTVTSFAISDCEVEIGPALLTHRAALMADVAS